MVLIFKTQELQRKTYVVFEQEERGQKRLQFLLKQAEVFQHFAPAASEREKKCALCSKSSCQPFPASHGLKTVPTDHVFCGWLVQEGQGQARSQVHRGAGGCRPAQG